MHWKSCDCIGSQLAEKYEIKTAILVPLCSALCSVHCAYTQWISEQTVYFTCPWWKRFFTTIALQFMYIKGCFCRIGPGTFCHSDPQDFHIQVLSNSIYREPNFWTGSACLPKVSPAVLFIRIQWIQTRIHAALYISSKASYERLPRSLQQKPLSF